jgi:hypothetical protein
LGNDPVDEEALRFALGLEHSLASSTTLTIESD